MPPFFPFCTTPIENKRLLRLAIVVAADNVPLWPGGTPPP